MASSPTVSLIYPQLQRVFTKVQHISPLKPETPLKYRNVGSIFHFQLELKCVFLFFNNIIFINQSYYIENKYKLQTDNVLKKVHLSSIHTPLFWTYFPNFSSNIKMVKYSFEIRISLHLYKIIRLNNFSLLWYGVRALLILRVKLLRIMVFQFHIFCYHTDLPIHFGFKICQKQIEKRKLATSSSIWKKFRTHSAFNKLVFIHFNKKNTQVLCPVYSEHTVEV